MPLAPLEGQHTIIPVSKTELPARHESEVGVNGDTASSGPLAQLAEQLTNGQ